MPREPLHSDIDASASAHATRITMVELARFAVLVFALLYLIVYLGCALLRLSYPWEIEWMEGGMIVHAARVLRGLPIYARPSLDFIAYFYTPGYPIVLAALSHLTGGLSFALARAVSLGASVATMLMMYRLAHREAGVLAGLLAIGLYAALYRITGAFYDIARADSLSLAWLSGAVLLAYTGRTQGSAACAAVLVVLAFFTKQTAGIMGPFIGLYLLLSDRRRALTFAAVGLSCGAAAGAYLQHSTGGWFSFYIVQGHQGHQFHTRNFLLKYWRDLLFLCPFVLLLPTLGASYGRRSRWLVALCLLWWIMAFRDRLPTLAKLEDSDYHALWYEPQRTWLIVFPLVITLLLSLVRYLRRELMLPHWYFSLLYVGSALASDLNHSTQWAYINCYMPVALFGSLYSGMVIAKLLKTPRYSTRRERLSVLATSLAVCLQFVALAYDPRAQIPTDKDRAALSDMVHTLDQYEAPVFIPGHPLYSFLRDGTLHTHQMGFGDVRGAGGVPDCEKRLSAGEFPTVVLDEGFHLPGVKTAYKQAHKFRYGPGTLIPRTGFAVKPGAIYVRRHPKK